MVSAFSLMSPSATSKALTTIELFKEEMKFSAGHFTIFSATERENLHGHNFSVYVSLTGEVDENGMCANYSRYKRVLFEACSRWDETFLLPGRSPHLRVEEDEAGNVVARFGEEVLHFLRRDATVLPVRNVTLEEMSRLLGETLVSEQADALLADRIQRIVVKCSSGPGQWASWSWEAA